MCDSQASTDHPVLSRRAALLSGAAAFVAGTAGSLAVPAAPAEAGVSASGTVFGWGASSMAGGRWQEAGRYRVLEGIGEILGRRTVNYARDGFTSHHSMCLRSYYAPRMTLSGGVIPSDTRRVRATVSSVPYFDALNGTGWLNGVRGRFVSSRGQVYFQRVSPGRSVRVRDNRFVFEAGKYAQPGLHLYWMGKNDLVWRQYSRQTMIDNQRRAWSMIGSDQWRRNFIIGQWKTYKDSDRVKRDVDWMNAKTNYYFGGKYWLDVQRLLTTSWGLDSPVIADMRLMSDPTAMRQARNGMIPRALVAADGMHFNARGNQVIAWAAAQKLRALGW